MFFFVNSQLNQPPETSSNFCSNKCLQHLSNEGMLQCNCGEEASEFEWTWQDCNSSNVRISKEGREVTFHPVYSSGTAAVKGQVPFQQNYHYYWEIKILTKLYGTDVMIGVGSSKVDFNEWQLKFCSLLGNSTESWGYSYHGRVYHNKLRRKYGRPFGVGSIIGIHLDMCNGTLEYFLNRQALGIAFTGLKGLELFPMVSSTAARSSVRITCCLRRDFSMEAMCLRVVMQHPALYQSYKEIPGLSRMFDRRYFWMQPQFNTMSNEKKRLAELDDDVLLSLINEGSLQPKNKKLRLLQVISLFKDELTDEERPSTSGDSSSGAPDSKVKGKVSLHVGHYSDTDTDSDEETLGLLNWL